MINGGLLEVLRDLFVQGLDDRDEQSPGKNPGVMISGLVLFKTTLLLKFKSDQYQRQRTLNSDVSKSLPLSHGRLIRA